MTSRMPFKDLMGVRYDLLEELLDAREGFLNSRSQSREEIDNSVKLLEHDLKKILRLVMHAQVGEERRQ